MDGRNEASPVRDSRLAALLAFLAIYRVVIVELVHLVLYAGFSVKAAEAAIAECVRLGLVRSQKFVGNRRAYSLTTKGAALVGLSGPCFRGPAGPLAVYQRLLIAWFCEAGEMRRRIMTAHKFRERFPVLAKLPGAIDRYFLDRETESNVLTLIVCDACDASFDAVVRKARRMIDERRQHQAFRDLMFAKPSLFAVAVITPFETKAERIREALETEKCAHSVHHVAGLEDLFMFGGQT